MENNKAMFIYKDVIAKGEQFRHVEGRSNSIVSPLILGLALLIGYLISKSL